jgi:hypothetical protein
MSKINIVVAAQTGGAIKGLNDVTAATRRTGAAVKKAQVGMGRFSGEVRKSQIAARKFAMGGLQQAGYQIGDYAVQVANGTSKMQAFGQQAPQLLQIFGPIGAVVGAGVAIFSAFAVALQRSTVEVKNADEALSGLIGAMGKLKSLESDLERMTRLMKSGFSESTEEVRSLISALIEAERIKVLSNLAAGFSGVSVSIAEASDALSDLENRKTPLQAQLDLLKSTDSQYRVISGMISEIDLKIKGLGGSTQEFNNLFTQIQSLTRETDPKKLVEGLAKVRADALEIGGPIGKQVVAAVTAAATSAGVLESVLAESKEGASNLESEVQKVGRSALSAAEAMFLLNKGILPPQARADLIDMNGLYERIRATISGAADQAARLGRTTLSAVEAEFMLRKGSLPDGAREDFPKIDKSYQVIRESIERANKSAERLGSTSVTSAKKIAAAVTSEVTPAMNRLQGIQDSIGQSFENAMMSAVDGTKSVKEAFRSMAVEIIKELYRVFVVKRITGFITDAISGYFNMNQVSGPPMPLGTGSVRPMARPSYSGGGYTGDGARAGGLDGKGGFMAMMHPRETVVDHTRGQSSGGVTVVQNNTFGSGVSRAEVNAMLPKMVEATKAAVADAKLRGGSYGGAFA